ncbi:MAG: non-heme iron oxygenase ferredoxin subunit [Gammaproteobacteria bacterium]
MADFVRVAKTTDIAPGESHLVEANGKRVAVFNCDGEFFAVDDGCTHRGGPLSDGELSGHTVTCPWHGASFDVRTGEVTGWPARKSVGCYSVRLRGDDIEIEV